MKNLSISFKNCESSVALKSRIEALADEAQTIVKRSQLTQLHVTVSEENGLRADGPDVFKCVLVGKLGAGQTLRFSPEASSAYDAVDIAFALLRRRVLEGKRSRIDRRNDRNPRTSLRYGGRAQ